MPTIKKIVTTYLRKNGYDGLVNRDLDCGCGVNELSPCDYCDIFSCEPGHKCDCTSCTDIGSCEISGNYGGGYAAGYCIKPGHAKKQTNKTKGRKARNNRKANT